MPKKFKKLFGATQGASKMDLEELLGRLPQGNKAQQLEAELMFKRLQEEQAARYAPTNLPTAAGKEGSRQAQAQLRERGKQKFLEPSTEKRRMYHGTRHYKPGTVNFDPTARPSGEGLTDFKESRRGMTFLSPDIDFANTYAGEAEDAIFKSGAVYPVHVQVRNPFDFQNAEHVDVLTDELSKLSGTSAKVPGWIHAGPEKIREELSSGAWDAIENQFTVDAAKRLGFDGMYMNEQGVKNLGVFDPKRIKSAIGNVGDYDIENPDITKAEGGLAHLAGGGSKLRKALKGASKVDDAVPDIRALVDANRPLTAAERAMVGKLAAEYTANQPVTRLSEALGNVGAEGKNLRVTQTDRTGAKYLGGAPFSMMQKVDPRYAQSKATWGVKTPGAAKNITNQSDADVVWSTLIGSPTQHRSNELIFDKLYRAFQKSAKEGNLSTELRTKFNAALQPIFGEGADILDPKLRKEIDTFEKRAVVGNLLLGEGLGGAQRGGSIIPGTKIMSETTEPMLRDVETFSIGPRLFTLDQGVITRPDLHPAFPEILTGEDLGQLFTPVPNRIALPTFNEDFMARTGRKKPGYYDLTMTPAGEPYPTQFVDEKYLTNLQKEGYAHGGVVHMQGGGDPGEVSGNEFSPKPLTIPAPLTDLADAIKRQFSKEKRSYSKPGAATDVLLGDVAAPILGAPGDFLDDVGKILEHVQKTHPLMREKASVMDTGPERTPPMGYAPKVKFAADGQVPLGSEQMRETMRRAGLITEEQRPLTGLAASILAPGAITKGLKVGKALAPTATDILETQLQRATSPMRMNIVPEGSPSGKAKAPANDIGFYNPAEKAALNIQRKQGPGSAFVSDMKKTPGVNDERLTELGLGDLASRQNVTRDEVLAATEQNRIPLRETVSRERDQAAIDELEQQYDDLIYEVKNLRDRDDPNPTEIAKVESDIRRNLDEQKRLKDIGQEAKFGPATSPDYSLPGGENYREIRVGLPEMRDKPPSMEGFTVETKNENKYTGQRDILIRDPQGNVVVNRYGFRGDDAQALRNEAASRVRNSGKDKNFYHSTHHGDEPNVLFHLRVADHVDAEGKKGLLIDELQSDWHQKGRSTGYKGGIDSAALDKEMKDIVKERSSLVKEFTEYASKNNDAISPEMQKRWNEFKTREDAIDQKRKKAASAVPDAPFKDNWYQLGLKRAIKEAADTGMDRVYLTTGARQADRYDLSKRVSYIDYRKSSVYDKYELGIADINGDPINLPKERYSAEELQDVVGKEVADKIIKGEGESGGGRKTLRGLDLKIGGEGMKQYYDKTYKNFLDKYAKQFGGKVGETKIADGEPVYYIDITPKMRESAAKGQSYKKGGAVKMAAGGAVDYESRFNQMLQDHVAGMADGGAVDYESRFNDMLQKHVQGMAEGGAMNEYNSDPDMSDGGRFIQAPAFADGGAVKSIWTVN